MTGLLMRTLCLLSAILLLFGGTSGQAAKYRDALERQVQVPEPPRRIISLAPAVTEILYALELQDRLVANTKYGNYPPAARQLPKVGEYANPGLERILLQRPDLVIAAADMNSPALVEQLKDLDIPTYVVYPHTVAEALATIRQIGAITGKSQAAATLAADIERRIDNLQKKLPSYRPTTLEAVMLQPLTVAGPDTFVADIIRLAGGRNAVPKSPSRYPTWDPEALLTFDPEVIVVSLHPGQPDPQAFFARWPQLQAVQNQRVIRVEADWIHRPGPRLIRGIEALARALHPDIDFDD
jgi:iron complex transport system substrate-binding protein